MLFSSFHDHKSNSHKAHHHHINSHEVSMLLGQVKNQLYTIYSFVPRVSAIVAVGLMKLINILSSRREPSKMQVALVLNQRCCKQLLLMAYKPI